MHARVLVELAALLASNGEVVIRGGRRLPSGCLAEYWAASKCRLDRWARAVKSVDREFGATSPDATSHHGPSFRPWLEEIITGEVLTRVWTGVVRGVEKHHGLQEAEPVVRSVYVGHLEARRKALRLLVSGHTLSTREVVALNRLRRRTERWTDMLLGYLAPLCDIRELAFDPRRAADFADGMRSERGQVWGAQAWPLVLSSLRAAFLTGMDPHAPNDDLNARIVSSVIACFGPDLFDSTGQFQSVWQARLTYATSDTLGMIDQLLGEEPTALSRGTDPTASRDARNRWTRPSS